MIKLVIVDLMYTSYFLSVEDYMHIFDLLLFLCKLVCMRARAHARARVCVCVCVCSVHVHSLIAVSYTHLDVYKRQRVSLVVKAGRAAVFSSTQ